MKTNVGVKCGWMQAATLMGLALLSLSTVAQAQPPVPDFTASPQRQAPGAPIQFTDLSISSDPITRWEWDFDNNGTVDSTARNPQFSYAAVGTYSVTLWVYTANSAAFLTRDGFIEILAPPFADFVGVPQQGTPPLTVNFTDTSQGGPNNPAVRWLWDFGDETGFNTQRNPQHTYTEAGQFTVTLKVTFQNGTTAEISKTSYIVVEESQEPTATFDTAGAIRDQESLVPLMDWVPLFTFNLTYGEDDPAPRFLAELDFTVSGGLWEDDQPFAEGPGPAAQDLLDFAIFQTGTEEELFTDFLGQPIYQWSSLGSDLATLSGGRGGLQYHLNFLGTGSESNPQFPLEAVSSESELQYVVAVRTSALWHSPNTLGVAVTGARMVNPNGLEPEDSYPEFPIFENTGYSSSFGTWDWTGRALHAQSPQIQSNSLDWPRNLYTPLAEHARPRWDLPGLAFEFVMGEVIDQRELFPIEQWIPLVGINAHSTWARHANDPVSPTPPNVTWFIEEQGFAGLREVNMIFTDEGAQPGDPVGAGGFDPRLQLDPITAFWEEIGDDANTAIGNDYSFNGVWVFYDTNNNAIFDPPVQNAGGGITMTDHPMIPEGFGINGGDQGTPIDDAFRGRWQYISNPPDGGSPWWRIKMRFDIGRRRNSNDDTPTGFLEAVPDVVSDDVGSEFTNDFFVVMRADSGFQDVSLVPGDGNGYLPGADFRAFVEPRWFDPVQQHWQGGILFDSQIPGPGQIVEDRIISAWQDDARWLPDEPWWTERTSPKQVTLPVRGGFELHDYVLLYNSNNDFKLSTDIDYTTSNFWAWLDPTGTYRDRFFYGDAAPVFHYSEYLFFPIFGAPVRTDDLIPFGFPFETAPFLNPFDTGEDGPRSPVYTRPPDQPTLPVYDTWPANLPPERYPSILDWAPEDIKARLLKQHVDIESIVTPMMGINLVGADDVVTNRVNARYLNDLYVAFWGPDFTPEDLLELDPKGISSSSGVHLRVDSGDGTFASILEQGAVDPPMALKNLAWADDPERVDLDGDGQADDLNGDGNVNSLDRAWVLRMTPATPWLLPSSDQRSGGGGGGGGGDGDGDGDGDGGGGGGDGEEEEKALTSPVTIDLNSSTAKASVATPKAINAFGNPGDDLLVTVQTSDELKRFEQFRIFVPVTLPDRPANQRQAGLRITPGATSSAGAYLKTNPDENVMQDYFFHDMLEANIPVRVVDMTGPGQTIQPNSEPFAALGIDASTNRGPTGVVARGSNGVGALRSFSVAGAAWTAGAFIGDFLIDRTYKAHEIVGNTNNALTLLGGTPASGRWFIARSPSFLEQVIVELYDEGGDGGFNVLDDLMPLDPDPKVSGVALYRDNDADPANNRNGEFDPGVDIPITLDGEPMFIGQSGEAPNQVQFVFSTPGTDDVPEPRADQPLRRQWIPDTFGDEDDVDDPDSGPDFFVVVRTSNRIEEGDDFRLAIVSWGPDTPTQPDADTFTRSYVPLTHRDDLSQFIEFPWGSRALGFITVFKNPPDDSGFNWIRSSAALFVQSKVITTDESGETDALTLTAIEPEVISTVTPDGGVTLTLTGTGFAEGLEVELNGTEFEVTSITDTSARVVLPGGTTFDEGEVAVTVRDTTRGREVNSSTLLTAVQGEVPEAPRIVSVTPSRGGKEVFPVTILGQGFENPQVYFGGTRMPIQSTNAAGTEIVVAFPAGGLALTGALDVEVRSVYDVGEGDSADEITLKAVKVNGFYFTNPPAGTAPACFIATAAYGTPFESRLSTFRNFRDGVLLKSAAGTAVVDFYYSTSPALADRVAEHPWLAALIRAVLTPVAWVIEQPWLFMAPLGVVMMTLSLRLRRRTGTH